MAQQTLIPPVPSLPTGKVRYEQFLQWVDAVEFHALGGVGNTCCRRGGSEGEYRGVVLEGLWSRMEWLW